MNVNKEFSDSCDTMKELQEILKEYEAIKQTEGRALLATIVKVRGSAHLRPGARMIIRENGTTSGTLNDDGLTAAVVKRAAGNICAADAITVSFDIRVPDTALPVDRPGRRSVVDVLLEPLPLSVRSLHARFISECLRTGGGVIASIFRVEGELRVRIGSHVFLSSGGTIEEDVRNPVLSAAIMKDCIEVLRSRTTIVKEYRFTEGTVESLIEFIGTS